MIKGKFPIKLKRKVMNSCLLPSLTYACQTWKFSYKIKHKIRSRQRGRSMLKIRLLEKVSHSDIRAKTRVIDELRTETEMEMGGPCG